MMAAVRERSRHDKSVSIRIPYATKNLIERAAVTLNKSFSAFVVESAAEHASDVLLNQTVFNLSSEQAEALAGIFDNPPAPTKKLRALMESKAPWE